MTLIFIEWLDATLISSSKWERVDKLASEGCHLYSAGLLVKQDAKGYYLAGDVDPADPNRVRCVSFIPKKMVRRIRRFTVK